MSYIAKAARRSFCITKESDNRKLSKRKIYVIGTAYSNGNEYVGLG